jgi:hypothetical protein
MANDLARKLAAHPRFRWSEGMRYDENATPGNGLCRGGQGRIFDDFDAVPMSATPDLADAATAGVLLSWLSPGVFVRQSDPIGDPDVWSVGTTAGTGWGRTLGEAAARAALALWEVPRG